MRDYVREILKEAEKHYGIHNQNIVAIEEATEFAKEICKYERGEGNRDNLISEMADLKIIYEATKIRYTIEDEELRERIDSKIKRLKDRLYYAKLKNDDKGM